MDLVHTIYKKLENDQKITIAGGYIGPWRITPSRRYDDVKTLSLDGRPSSERWMEAYSIIVSPKKGRYSAPLLQELLEEILPNRQAAEQRNFVVSKMEGRLKYGSKTFEEKVGEEITTIERKLETGNDLAFFKTGTKRTVTPIYQTVGVILCPNYDLALKEARNMEGGGIYSFNPFSISLKELEKLDPNHKRGLIKRWFGNNKEERK